MGQIGEDIAAGSPDGASVQAHAALERCFRDHYADLLAFALRRLGDRARAEDLAAETFVAAWRRHEALPSEPLPWLLGVARGLLANEARAVRRRSRLTAAVARQHGEPFGDPAELVAERAAALGALGGLSGRDQELLLLVAWEGLDAAAAARVLGCSRSTFAVRLHRARRRLAAELAAGAESAAPPAAGTKLRPDSKKVRTGEL